MKDGLSAMGADFHGVIEVDGVDEFPRPDGFAYIECPRCHDFFSILGAFGEPIGLPNRGIPLRISFLTLLQYGIEVVPDTCTVHSEWETITESNALEFLQTGDSHPIENSGMQSLWISKPGCKFPNWLTLTELLSATQASQAMDRLPNPFWKATVAAMQSLAVDGMACRLVYWFDV